jgi:hypothetical protein
METETRTIDGKSVTVSKNSGKTISFVVGKDEETGNNITETVSLPLHVAGKIGAIGTVYGGGNAAPVHGNTNVNIGTEIGNNIVFVSPATKTVTSTVNGVETTTEEPTTDAERTHEVKGVDIRGNVYGAGYGSTAVVTGNTNVVIGREETTTTNSGSSTTNP